MNYVAELYQSNGCDYTIGCGRVNHEFEADNMEHAAVVLKEYLDENYGSQFEEIEEITLYEVSCKKELPVEKWQQERIDAYQKEVNAVKEQKEKEEYERLKSKFE